MIGSGLLLLGLVLAMLALRQSIVLILLVVLAYAHVAGGGQLVYVVEDLWTAFDNYTLVAIPVYVFLGQLLTRGQIAEHLVAVTRAAVDWMPGGMGVATVISCGIFAAISGSSAATLLGMGAVMYPALLQAGYGTGFSLGAVTASGTLGILIPPSIPLIIYGLATETNVAALFLAALLPGVLLTGLFCLYCIVIHRKQPLGRFSARRLLDAAQAGFPALLAPVILLSGIYSGWFSPVEAAAVAAGYAFLVERYVYRSITWSALTGIGRDTAILLGTLFPIVAVAIALKTVLAVEGIPGDIAAWVTSMFQTKFAFLLAVNLLLLAVGCVIDAISAILLLAPVLLAAASAYGISPVHLGVIMVINLEIGLLTPPLGMNLLVAAQAFEARFMTVARSVLPFIGLMLVVLMAVTFVPLVF